MSSWPLLHTFGCGYVLTSAVEPLNAAQLMKTSMPRPRRDIPTWAEKVADIMVREARSMRQAADQLDIVLTTQQAEKIGRQRAFQDVLWAARQHYFQHLGSDPLLTKDAVVGQMSRLAKDLTDEGHLDKAATVLFQIARMRDWVGPESNINVFADLSQKDLDEIKDRLREHIVGESSEGTRRASKTSIQ